MNSLGEVNMLRLEKIHGQNVWDILRLKVAEDQRHFVASNETSIIEAYTTIVGNGHAFPFGIYEDDTPVGFYSYVSLWSSRILLAVIRVGE